MDPNYVFICGCPRSGTTFLANFLNKHPRICIGIERYGNLFFKEPLTTALFKRDRFFDIRSGDTFYTSLDFSDIYEKKYKFFDSSILVGDKIPLLFRYLDQLKINFPGARLVFCVRNIFDVASSYERRALDRNDTTWATDKDALASIVDWNSSLHSFLKHGSGFNAYVFDYDLFFNGDTTNEQARRIFDWLDVGWTDSLQGHLENFSHRARELEFARRRDLAPAILRAISLQAAFGPYRRVLEWTR
ncbi:MAG: sulfotransferase [Candidatus Binatia bacterium]